MQNDKSGFSDFEVKTSSSETFFKMNMLLYDQFFGGDVVNMVSREVLESHVRCF